MDSLEWNLSLSYHLLVKAFVDAGATLTDRILEDHLPGIVFSQALSTEPAWMEEPPDIRELRIGEQVTEMGRAKLGGWEVPEQFRRDFLDLLPIGLYRDHTKVEWYKPTPARIVSSFQDVVGLKDTDCIRAMLALRGRLARVDQGQILVRSTGEYKAFYRIKNEPEPPMPTRLNDNHACLGKMIRSTSRTPYPDLDDVHLVWRIRK